VSIEVDVKEIEVNKRVLIEWGNVADGFPKGLDRALR
jgi:hypothetical protein